MSATYKLRSDGGRYVVVDDKGQAVSAPITNRSIAETVLENAERKARTRRIACLRCRSDFDSEGPHNRLCLHCRTRTAGPFDLDHSVPSSPKRGGVRG